MKRGTMRLPEHQHVKPSFVNLVFLPCSRQEEAAAGREVRAAEEKRQAGELPEQEEEEERREGPQEVAPAACGWRCGLTDRRLRVLY